MARLPKLVWMTGLSVILASAVLPGCGDDDGDDDGTGGSAGAGKGGSTGGKGGSTGGTSKGGSTTGGTSGGATDGGATDGGAPVVPPVGGAGGDDPMVTGGAGPVVGGAGGSGGEPVVAGGVGGEGGGSGGAPVVDGGEGGIGGMGGAEVDGGAGGAEGGAGGAGEPDLECTSATAAGTDPPFTSGVGKNCVEFCADLFDFCDTALGAGNPFDNEAECVVECASLDEEDLCCVAAHAVEADVEGTAGHCDLAASQEACYTE